MASAYLLDLPLLEYAAALNLQRTAVTARRSGRLDRDLIILLEHPPVFTLGRRGGLQNLRVPEDRLRQKGIAIVAVERGGDITYHGPGQLVVYPLIDLTAARINVVTLVERLEQAMVRIAAQYELEARGDAVHRGAWIGRRKLGSVGITIRRGISFHGLALNVSTDLSPFAWINPCGIPACEMTSLSRETGTAIDMPTVRRRMSAHLSALFDLDYTPIALPALESILD
jgi:lipoate-protein ligase B